MNSLAGSFSLLLQIIIVQSRRQSVPPNCSRKTRVAHRQIKHCGLTVSDAKPLHTPPSISWNALRSFPCPVVDCRLFRYERYSRSCITTSHSNRSQIVLLCSYLSKLLRAGADAIPSKILQLIIITTCSTKKLRQRQHQTRHNLSQTRDSCKYDFYTRTPRTTLLPTRIPISLCISDSSHRSLSRALSMCLRSFCKLHVPHQYGWKRFLGQHD